MGDSESTFVPLPVTYLRQLAPRGRRVGKVTPGGNADIDSNVV